VGSIFELSRDQKRKLYSEGVKSRTELDKEFDANREQAFRRVEAMESLDRMERASRRQDMEAEAKREWQAFLATLEQERQKDEVEQAMKNAKERVEKESEADAMLRSVAADRRRARAEEFTRQLPSSRALELMDEGDVYLLRQVLTEKLQAIDTETRNRKNRPCYLCQTSQRTTSTSTTFSCFHSSVCEMCYEMCVECPICGGSKQRKL
jgi:preprotein translocase subunit SecD